MTRNAAGWGKSPRSVILNEVKDLASKRALGRARCFAALSMTMSMTLCVLAAPLIAGCGEPAPVRVARKGIISLGPNITETIFALGQGSLVIAVCTFCDYPPEVGQIERIGGYFDPDLEKITLLAPELIIAQGTPEKVVQLARHNGIPLLEIYMDSIATIDEGVAKIGEALGCPKEADVLRAKIRAQIETVRETVKGLPRPKVLLITGRMDHNLNSLNTAGGPSFLSELVDVAGGENMYKSANLPYLAASKETVVMEGPEAILEFHAGEDLSPEEQARYVADWQQLTSVPAVVKGRVYVILESYTMRPGPRVALVARQIALLLHPDARIPEL